MKQFEEGKKYFMKGVDGNKKAVKHAYDIFLKLRSTNPDNALIEAYYGSTLTLLARDDVQPLEKADKAQEGLDALNHAVSMDSNHKEIRMLRSKVCLRLPESYFHCSKKAVEDITFLLDRYQKDPSYLTDNQVKELKEDLSTAYKNMGKPDEARKALQRSSNVKPKKKVMNKTEEKNERLVKVSKSNSELLHQQVGSLYRDAVKGNEKALQDLHQLLERVRPDYSDTPLLDAYHGSTKIIIARDMPMSLERLRWTKSGLKLLDEAVSAAPQDSMIRFLRGKTTYRLPEKTFHRGQKIINDYIFLIDRHLHGEGFLNTNRYWQLVYELGEVYYRIDRNQEARMCWLMLKNKTQDPDFLHLLNLKLKNIENKPAVESRPDKGA